MTCPVSYTHLDVYKRQHTHIASGNLLQQSAHIKVLLIECRKHDQIVVKISLKSCLIKHKILEYILGLKWSMYRLLTENTAYLQVILIICRWFCNVLLFQNSCWELSPLNVFENSILRSPHTVLKFMSYLNICSELF